MKWTSLLNWPLRWSLRGVMGISSVLLGWISGAWESFLGKHGYKAIVALVAAYIGLYAILEVRHELRANRASFKLATFMSMVSSTNPGSFISAMTDFGPLQNMQVPSKPEFLEPWKWFGEQDLPNKKPLKIWARHFLKHCKAERCGDSEEYPEIRIVLAGAVLSEADLRGSKLHEADLSRAKLNEADMRGADLRWADLSSAHMRNAKLSGADLRESRLRGADMRGASLELAELHGADLSMTNLLKAKYLNANQVKAARNWEGAFYSEEFLKQLGLPANHNETILLKLDELINKKRPTHAKP